MANNAAGLVKQAYEKLKSSDAENACVLLEQALDIDYENDEVKHALKCVHWWLEHTRRIDEINSPYEKGGFLLSLFKQYYVFLDQLDDIYDQCQYAARCYVYSKALVFFESLLQGQTEMKDPELLLMIGKCHKGLGNYDEALKYLEQAYGIKKDSAQILAELADVNDLLSDTRCAKTLFREAFFTDPFAIELKSLESGLIQKLVNEVSALGYSHDELNAWIPVYGNLWNVFSVKRELKQMEAAKLKQAIFSMETEYEANPSNQAKRALLKPLLLNRYFWLIDHCEKNGGASSSLLAEETLLKIKVLDRDIYKIYAGN